MKRIKYWILIISILTLFKNDLLAQHNAFPFLKPGNEWVYEGDAGSGKFTIAYKILSQPKKGYYQIQTRLLDNAVVNNDMYWHADSTTFSFYTGWPQSPLKLTLISSNPKVGDMWEVFLPASLDPKDDELSGLRKTEVISINETILVAGEVFENCIRIKETFSSEPKYVMNYLFHKRRGLLKMEGTLYMREDDKERTFYPIKYELKGKEAPEEKPSIAITGCINLVVGESSLLPVSFKPTGGTMRYWTEGKGITVSDGGNGANIKATEPGKSTVWAEYTTPKGVKIKQSKTIYILKLHSINNGNPLQVGLYDVKGKPSNGIKSVPVEVQPAGEVTQLRFKPADASLISAAPSGQNQLKVQGVKKGQTTVQAYSDCGTPTGPQLQVEIVNCDDEVVKELRTQEKLLKSRLESNLKQVAELLGNKEFKEADENGPRAIYDVNKGIRDLLLLSSIKGNGANQQALKRIVGTLSDYESLAFHAGDKNSLLFKWQAINMRLPEGPAKTISSLIKTVLELSDATGNLSSYLGTMLGVSDRLDELSKQYEKTEKEYLEVTRVLYKICRRDGEPEQPIDKPDKPSIEPSSQNPKKPLTASGKHELVEDENFVDIPISDESITPTEVDPPPVKTEPEKIKKGLFIEDEEVRCDCEQQTPSEFSTKNLGKLPKENTSLQISIKNLSECYDQMNQLTLIPFAQELSSIQLFFEEIESMKALKIEDQKEKIAALPALLKKTSTEKKLELQFEKLDEFEKKSNGCPQKIQDNWIQNLKIHWDRLL